MLKRMVATLSAVFVAVAILATVAAGPASAGTCGETFQPRVNGGEAAWSLYCYGGSITIDGWVKDTKKDGKCAWVKAFGGEQAMQHAKACPAGTVTHFEWTTGGNEIRAYLYVV
jgi:hypothetical protein